MRWIPGPSGGGPPSKSAQPRRSEALSPTCVHGTRVEDVAYFYSGYLQDPSEELLHVRRLNSTTVKARERPEDAPLVAPGRLRGWQHLIRVKVSRHCQRLSTKDALGLSIRVSHLAAR